MGGDSDIHNIQSTFTRLYNLPVNYLTIPYLTIPQGIFRDRPPAGTVSTPPHDYFWTKAKWGTESVWICGKIVIQASIITVTWR
jgi:hypothetical protein